jgi:hypothetical protein
MEREGGSMICRRHASPTNAAAARAASTSRLVADHTQAGPRSGRALYLDLDWEGTGTERPSEMGVEWAGAAGAAMGPAIRTFFVPGFLQQNPRLEAKAQNANTPGLACSGVSVSVVAGVGFEPTTFRL